MVKFINYLVLVLAISFAFVFPLNSGAVYGAAFTTQEEVYSVCGGPPGDVKSSLVLSIVTMCLPGILEKTNQWKQIKCQEIECTYEAVKNGLDPSFCEKQKAYGTCKYIVSEVFALPGFSMLEYWRNTLNQLLANPVGILWSVGAKLARKTVGTCQLPGSTFACNSQIIGGSALFLAVTDVLGVVQTLKQMFENGLFNFDFLSGGSDSQCERVQEIREEMAEILDIEIN